MHYQDGTAVHQHDVVKLDGAGDHLFEVRSYRSGGAQVVVANITPGFEAIGTSTVPVRDLIPQHHVLVAEPDPEDAETLLFRVECPTVTDRCREYRDCQVDDDGHAQLGEADTYRPVLHGKRHEYIAGQWMAETDRCYLANHDGLPDAADGYFPPGRHPIDFDSGDGTDLALLPLPPQPTTAAR